MTELLTDRQEWDPEVARGAVISSVETCQELLDNGQEAAVREWMLECARAFREFLVRGTRRGLSLTQILVAWRGNAHEWGDIEISLWCLIEQGTASSEFMALMPEHIRRMVMRAIQDAGLIVHAPDGSHRSRRH